MKRSLFVCLAMLLNVSVSNALNLNDVVLGEDALETPTIYSFPCSKYIDIMSCGGNQLILEKNCKATLKMEAQGLSCRSLRGDTVVFAKVLKSSRFVDRTLGGMGGYHLEFSKRVKLQSFQTPNGNTEYQLVVQ